MEHVSITRALAFLQDEKPVPSWQTPQQYRDCPQELTNT